MTARGGCSYVFAANLAGFCACAGLAFARNINALFYHYDGTYRRVAARDQLTFGQPDFVFSNDLLQSVGNIQVPENARLLFFLWPLEWFSDAPIGQVAVSAAPSGFKTYASSSLHFRIAYPASWRAKPNHLGAWFLGPVVQHTTTVVTISPLYDAHPFPSLDTAVSMIERLTTGATFSGATNTMVGGIHARMVSITKVNGERGVMVLFRARGRIWLLTYRSGTAGYGKYFDLFRTMMASFALV